jgi:biopolymer transport protein ExbD
MSMNVPSSSSEESDAAISEINTTPLVDVMLVLLIIFLITVPVISATVPLNLPKARNVPTETKPENITIAVDVDGNVYWNMSRVPDSKALLERFKDVARMQPQPEVHVRGDRGSRYEGVGRVILTAQRAGVQKVGFITEPDRGGPR